MLRATWVRRMSRSVPAGAAAAAARNRTSLAAGSSNVQSASMSAWCRRASASGAAGVPIGQPSVDSAFEALMPRWT